MSRNPLTLYQQLLQRTLIKARPASLKDGLKRLLGVRRLPVDTARGKSCDEIQVMLADCGYEITKPFGHWVWTAPDA